MVETALHLGRRKHHDRQCIAWGNKNINVLKFIRTHAKFDIHYMLYTTKLDAYLIFQI